MLLADPRQENVGGVLNYDLFFKLFHQFTGLEFGIKGLRILRVVSYFFGAYALTVFWKNLFPKSNSEIIVFILALSGLFAGYGFLPHSLSYNSISVVSTCFWLALLSKPKLRSLHYVLLGVVFLVLFYSKATVCLVLGLITLIYLGYGKQLNIYGFAFLILPTILFEALSFAFLNDSSFLRFVDDRSFIVQREDYTFMLLLKYTSVGIFWTGMVGLVFFIASLVGRRTHNIRYLVFCTAIGILGLVFFSTLITSEWSHAFLLILVAWIAWCLGQNGLASLDKKQRFFFFLLMSLPFALHFGSNVYWMRLGIHYLVFWIFAATILLGWKEWCMRRFVQMISFSSFVLVLFGLWVVPFELEPNWTATETWEYRPGKEVSLSKAQVILLEQLKSETKDIQNGEVAALYMNSGLLYLLGMNSPHIPGYWSESQARLFLDDHPNLEVLMVNELDKFPFPKTEWRHGTTLIEPNGNELTIRWKR